jgi:hypothetical protein
VIEFVQGEAYPRDVHELRGDVELHDGLEPLLLYPEPQGFNDNEVLLINCPQRVTADIDVVGLAAVEE